ncbi:hypothetical protein FRC17_007471 [Serendipita sp. 399]|nr:hypothetical protein FRC17_007471 [Serendipita sp. 399]
MYEFLPAWHVPPGFTITRPLAVLGLLQYDAATAYFATIVTGILLLDTAGPAALVAALWMEREQQMTNKQKRLKRSN